MIEVKHLTKRYGQTVAVDEVSFVVEPGRVTGFLRPNGAGQVDDDADDPGPGRAELRLSAGVDHGRGRRIGGLSDGFCRDPRSLKGSLKRKVSEGGERDRRAPIVRPACRLIARG
jgi:hypothetical protein